jgi:hypothetical protein
MATFDPLRLPPYITGGSIAHNPWTPGQSAIVGGLISAGKLTFIEPTDVMLANALGISVGSLGQGKTIIQHHDLVTIVWGEGMSVRAASEQARQRSTPSPEIPPPVFTVPVPPAVTNNTTVVSVPTTPPVFVDAVLKHLVRSFGKANVSDWVDCI